MVDLSAGTAETNFHDPTPAISATDRAQRPMSSRARFLPKAPASWMRKSVHKGPRDSMPDRGRIDRSSRLGREHDREGSDDEDRSDQHHQAVGRQHLALAVDEVVEHLAAHLRIDPWR